MLRTFIDKMKDNSFKLANERSRKYPAQTITDADYVDGIALSVNTPTEAETLLRKVEQAAAGIRLYVNTDKTEYMCFNQRGDISTLNGSSLKLTLTQPKKQCLINRDWHQHETSEGMDS